MNIKQQVLTFINKVKERKVKNCHYQNKMSQTNQIKFPPIHQYQKTDGPFQIPNDNQALLESRQEPNDKNINNGNQKIWDKKTASCRTALKRFDKFVIPQDNNYVPLNNFNTKQKKVIENALEIIQMRKKNKDLAGKNQTIVDILQQKKEMFLVTMTHQIIDKQINNLKSQANERQKALKQSNQILEQDIQDFDQYQEKYKNQTKKIEEQFQRQVQKRLVKQQEIKSKQITVNSLRAQKARNQESISSYLKYKKFLDQLPPKEWLQERQNKKLEKIHQIKKDLQNEWMNGRSSSSGSMNKKTFKEQFQKIFSKIVEQGQNETIEEINSNEEMYFKQPSEMIQFFNNLQQTNLFCIQNSQYAQQNYQQLKAQSETKKAALLQKYQTLKHHKNILEKQLFEIQNQVKQLRKKKQQNNSLDQKDNNNIKAMISSQYQVIKDIMHNYMPEIEYNAQSLQLLSGIQICMERLWDKLRECYTQNPKAIKEIKTQFEKKKNNQKREEAAKNNKLQQEKRKIRNLEKKQPTLKVQGRLDMKRSPPQQKLVTKKLQITNKDQDDDRKYLTE